MFSLNRLFLASNRRRISATILLLTLFLGIFIFGGNMQSASASTLTVPDNYSTIQAAINAASPGDTIFVRAGIYNGKLTVNKTISLIGENRASTFINESIEGYDLVTVEANGVLISNFTLKGYITPPSYPGGLSYVSGNGITIKGNNTSIINVAIPVGNAYGMVASNVNNLTVNGTLIDNNIFGADFDSCKGIMLADNTFRNNYGVAYFNQVPSGFGLDLSYCDNVTMRRNQFNNNIEDFKIDGDELSNFLHDIDTSNVLVDGVTRKIYYLLNQNDKAINKTGYPDLGCLALVNSTNIDVQGFDLIDCTPAILLAYTNGSYVRNNTLSYCSLALSLVHSSNNIVSGNIISPNNTGAITVKYYSTNNTIQANSVTDNLGDAFNMSNSTGNIIADNNFANEAGGISLYYSDNNSLLRNNITNNSNGIELYYSSNNLLRNNNMTANNVNFQVVAYYDTTLSMFTHDVDTSNTVNGKLIYYLINHNDETVDPSSYPNAGFLAMVNSTKMTAKNLNLQGMLVGYTNNSVIQTNTLVNGADSITMVKSQGNSITQNNVTNDWYGIRLYDRSNNNAIAENTVRKVTDGIYLSWYCDSNTITGNIVTDNSGSGISAEDYTTRTVISGNNAQNNSWCGIEIGYNSFFNTISSNNATNNGDDGILIQFGENSTVIDNFVAGNEYDGIRVDGASNITISGNTIQDHGNAGVALRYGSYNNLVSGNNIKNSTMDGIQLFALPANCTIKDNNITGSGEDGIHMELSGVHNITGNNIVNSGRDGIYVEGFYETDYPEYTESFGAMHSNITFNNVTQSGRYCIYMLGYNNSINHNHFAGFTNAFYSDAAYPNKWDEGYPSGGNYWSNYNGTDLYSGPNQNIPGGDGIGDTPYNMNANNTDHYPLMQTPYYGITINAYCNTQSSNVSVPITKDGAASGQSTSYTFTNLLGTHNFTVPTTDLNGHPFKQWNTGQNTTTITVNATGSYVAFYEAPPYNVTIKAHCNTETTDVNVAITEDGTATGHSTPCNFTLSGNHTFSVPSTDGNGHPFKQWSTGQTSTTITVTSAGTYTAYYEAPAYNVTINAHCNTEAVDISVAVTKDGTPLGYNTPCSITLTGNHAFTVPSIDSTGHPFKQWSTGETSTTISVTVAGTYTAIYEGAAPTPTPSPSPSPSPSPTPPPSQTYSVTINAYCNTQHACVKVAITKDCRATCKYTPQTFTGLTGTHTFTVPSKDPSGHPFKQWNTGQTSTTIKVSSGGNYTAYYEAPPPPTPPPCRSPSLWHFPTWNFWWFWHW